jgi:hypothetical protein
MPVYESVCDKCGKVHDYVARIANYMDTPYCCGNKTRKIILTSPAGIVDIPAYQSPASGKWITSRAERREDLKRTGCREWEGMESEKKEAAKVKAEIEAKDDKFIEEAVVQAWQELPERKKSEAIAACNNLGV